MIDRNTSCELHNVPLIKRTMYDSLKVMNVDPTGEYMKYSWQFPHHTPFNFSETKLYDSEEPVTIVSCTKCDEELRKVLDASLDK